MFSAFLRSSSGVGGGDHGHAPVDFPRLNALLPSHCLSPGRRGSRRAWAACGGRAAVRVFLLLAALSAKGLATLMWFPPDQGRTLAFSLGTRNSFIVLPFALALPSGWDIAAVVIVVQSLVELFGKVFYLWWVPRRLFK